MKQSTRRVRRTGRAFFNLQILVALGGSILSVVLHELFHVAVHWGHITHIGLFPNSHAIMEVVSITPHGYNVQLEEAIAYAITLATLIATAVLLAKMHDKRDTRPTSHIIAPKHSPLRALSPKEFFELAARIRLL